MDIMTEESSRFLGLMWEYDISIVETHMLFGMLIQQEYDAREQPKRESFEDAWNVTFG